MAALATPVVRLSPTRPEERPALVALTAALRAKEPDLLDDVLRELLPLMRMWMFRLVGPGGDLDDAVQDALAEVAAALPRFEGRSSVATFAHRIALRTSRRHRPRRRPEPWVEPVDERSGPEEQIGARSALRRIHTLLDELPRRRREAFLLCAVGGMSPAEAAGVVGVSANAMRSRLHRARQELVAKLGEDDA